MLTILRTIGKVNVVIDNAELKAGKVGYYIQNNGNVYTREQARGKLGESTNEEIDAEHDSILADLDKIVENLNKKQETREVGFLERALLETLSQVGASSIVEQIKPSIDKFIKEEYGVKPEVKIIKTEFSSSKTEGVLHEEFETVLTLVGADIPVMLTGPAGTGKNYLVKQIAKALDLEFYFSNSVTQEYKITGFIDAHGNYHETEFYKAFKNGGLFMLDEIDASIPEVLVILNAAIANRYFEFPTGRIDAHPDFRVISAGNTFGTGADMDYVGRYQLDGATLDRFALVRIDYSKKIEYAIANKDEELLDFIYSLRKAVSDAGMRHIISYRGTEMVAKLVQTDLALES